MSPKVKEFRDGLVAFLVVFAIFLGICWMYGFTPDGIIYGHWPTINDHPENVPDNPNPTTP